MTSSKLHQIVERGRLIVGTGSANVPWHYRDDDGKLAGFDIEMGRILAKALFADPDQAEFIELSPDGRIDAVLSGRVDLVFQGMSMSAYRMKQVAFSVPYYTEGVGLIMRPGARYSSHADLVQAVAAGETVTIAVLENPDADEAVEEMVPGAQCLQVKEANERYDAVASGAADAGMADLSSITWLVKLHPDRWVDSGFSTHPQNYGAAMDPEDQVWINFVNGVLVDAMTGATHPEYDRAYEAYFGATPAAPQVGKPAQYRMHS